MTEYGYQVEVPEGYDEAVVRTRLATRGEGFSVITEMHVAGVLGPQAGDARQYLIMGAWDAESNRTTEGGLRVAVQIPCNIVVQETERGAIVAVLDPEEEIEGPDETMSPVAAEARNALHRVLEKVTRPL